MHLFYLRGIFKGWKDFFEDILTEIVKIELSKAIKQSAIDTLKTQIVVLNFEDWVLKLETALKEYADNCEKQHQKIENDFQTLVRKIQICQSEGQILRGGIDALNVSQTNLAATQATLKTELDAALKASHFDNIETIKDILASNLNVALERKKLNDFNEIGRASCRERV